MASRVSTVALVAATLFALAALCFGIAAVGSILFPGPSGEWAGIGVYAAYVVVLPIGLLTLLAARLLKSASPRLRRACTILSVLALLTPIAAHLIWRMPGHRV